MGCCCLQVLAEREHFHMTTEKDSHERSRAAHLTATEDEELCSKMRQSGV